MKNAAKHAEKLKSLFRTAMKPGKPEPPPPLEPLQALVRGAMSFDVDDQRAAAAMDAIQHEFVDLNELRVATDLEIQALLGPRYPDVEKRVEMITRALNYIFEKEHTLSLDRLKTLSRRDARAFMQSVPDLHPFVEAFVMLHAFGSHAVPLDDAMLELLVESGAVEAGTPLVEAQKFVEHQLKSGECYDFYASVRRMALDEAGAKRRK